MAHGARMRLSAPGSIQPQTADCPGVLVARVASPNTHSCPPRDAGLRLCALFPVSLLISPSLRGRILAPDIPSAFIHPAPPKGFASAAALTIAHAAESRRQTAAE